MRTSKADEKLSRIRSTSTPYTVCYSGVTVSVFKNVYPTSELSELIVEGLDDRQFGIKENNFVLDYGTGTGFLAIQAALRGANVVATDINPNAIECALSNAARFQLNTPIDIRKGDCLNTIQDHEKFDIIMAGLPFDDAEANDYLELSMYDPEYHMRQTLFNRAIQLLNPGGRIFMSYSESIQKRVALEKTDSRYTYQVFKNRIIKGEMHFMFMIRPNCMDPSQGMAKG